MPSKWAEMEKRMYANSDESLITPCPSCGNPLIYDSDEKLLNCENCDYEEDVSLDGDS